MLPQLSDAQLAANRANAQLSTGPKTPEGKAKVSQNARKLGLFVSDNTIIQENPPEFAELLAGLIADYLPQGTIEFELVRQLTVSIWRLRRYDRMETGRLDCEDQPETRHQANLSMASQFDKEELFLNRLFRARQQAERSFRNTYKDLEARKARRSSPRQAPEEIEIEVDSRHQPFPQIKPKVAEAKPEVHEQEGTEERAEGGADQSSAKLGTEPTLARRR